jgi:hypothetical protein
MLPHFIVLGPRKTGSSWLHECLGEHPQICLPRRVKEIFFFDRHFDRGVGWYERYFADCAPSKVIGEVSATYFSHPDAPRRLTGVCPQARLVATLRNPVERAWSMYLHLLGKGDTAAPLFEAARAHPEILDEGLYADQLRRWREHAVPDALMVAIYEDMADDPAAFVSAIYRFVGVDDGFRPQALHRRVNESEAPRSRMLARLSVGIARGLHRAGLHEVVGAAKALGAKKVAFREGERLELAMSPQDRARLADYYAADVAATSKLLGRDLTAAWLNG